VFLNSSLLKINPKFSKNKLFTNNIIKYARAYVNRLKGVLIIFFAKNRTFFSGDKKTFAK